MRQWDTIYKKFKFWQLHFKSCLGCFEWIYSANRFMASIWNKCWLLYFHICSFEKFGNILRTIHTKCNDYSYFINIYSNGPCNHPYSNTVLPHYCVLVIDLYMTVIRSMKLILNITHLILVVSRMWLPNVLLFFYASLLRTFHGFHRMPLSIFSLKFTSKSETNINNSVLLTLLAAWPYCSL